VQVPTAALYGAQTQRAVENFPISGQPLPRSFLRALGLVKAAAATANEELGLLDSEKSRAIRSAAQSVASGVYDAEFPIDVYQTGSGTSTNMNANEVISSLASSALESRVHPNDHVNMSQSSNDVIPTAIHVAAYLEAVEHLLPALRHLAETIRTRAASFDDVVKTGRTHLMDAMPIRLSQEFGGWASQVEQSAARIESTLPRLAELALGGTAVGTGINAPPQFAARFCAALSKQTGCPFREAADHFAAQAAMDSAVELSGQLRAAAVALTKIAEDLRWMNSGPIAGLGEIALPALQPGSSIMPGKVNPVIPEATLMVCARVMGNDVTVGIAGSRGNFQLNVMLPLLAHALLESLQLLGNAARQLADRAVAGLTVRREAIEALVGKNPILVTALNPVIGYELGARIAKTAYAEGRSLREVARELTDLTDSQLDQYLDPRPMTEGGIIEGVSGGG
jgi:fumarate hydratase class II